MRILVANVNTTSTMTDSIVGAAQRAAGAGTEIVGLTPRFGAPSVESNFESYLAAVAVMDSVMTFDGPYDAVIQAGYGEHGREGLQELLDVPVVDITEAAAHVAMLLGRSFSVVTTLDRAIPQIEDRLQVAGLLQRCRSIRAAEVEVLALESSPDEAMDAIEAQAALAITQDRAEVICLGCGGMAGLHEAISKRTGAPVVDGVTAAVKLAESLVQLGLSTSKIRTYAHPRPKTLTGWPLSR